MRGIGLDIIDIAGKRHERPVDRRLTNRLLSAAHYDGSVRDDSDSNEDQSEVSDAFMAAYAKLPDKPIVGMAATPDVGGWGRLLARGQRWRHLLVW